MNYLISVSASQPVFASYMIEASSLEEAYKIAQEHLDGSFLDAPNFYYEHSWGAGFDDEVITQIQSEDESQEWNYDEPPPGEAGP